ncbi:hypothetical protein [Engelhardtia mirabilis]|uniref:Uncharacterized protein n=1 Tax=Engelhardtia mirabilis TaxID=2528011 RepID=A0A518BL31_9BACT|nr:hypothetical protein Pla133_27690 [Planctomycetes bacterium Pla133]QDV02007.1 hypothetical protein Pla86_27680 [Planctomycetes bacterium Pla86]
MTSTQILVAGRIAIATLALAALAAVAAIAQEGPAPWAVPIPTTAATVRVTVPDTPSAWPLRFMVGTPKGVELHPGDLSPLTVLAPTGGGKLATQIDSILREPDGSIRSLWVSAMIPAGLEAGSELAIKVIESPRPKQGPALAPVILKALTKPNGWGFEVAGIDGGWYAARFERPATVIRAGPVETVFRISSPVLPVVLEKDPATQLPHLGVVTMDLRVWSGIEAVDIRVLWEGGAVDDPNAWALFDSATLRIPPGAECAPLMPTTGWGGVDQTSEGSMIRLAAAGDGLHATLPHHAKLWALGATAPGRWDDLEPILAGGGWGWADSGPWSPQATRCTTADLKAPPLGFLGLAGRAELAERARDGWEEARAKGWPLEGSYGPTSWRHPSGIGYGAMTGGEGIDPWPFLDFAWAAPAATFELLTGRLESRLDRTRVSLVHLDGTTWDPSDAGAPFNFVASPEPPYAPGWITAWPSYSQDPLGFRDARPEYREATAKLADAALVGDRSYGTDDMQHWVRGRRALWPLVELYGEPMARLLLERQSAAVRADLFDGEGAGEFTETLAWMNLTDGQGQDFGRDFAWAGHHIAMAYAAGSDAERAALAPWCATWVDVLQSSLTANGSFQVITEGKELGYALQAAADNLGEVPAFYPSQTYQNCLVAGAGLQMRGAFLGIWDRDEIDLALSRIAQGISTVAWGENERTPDYRFAASFQDGQALAKRAEVEATYSSLLHPKAEGDDGNKGQSLHVALALAAGLICGPTHEIGDAADRFLGDDWIKGAQLEVKSAPGNGAVLLGALLTGGD